MKRDLEDLKILPGIYTLDTDRGSKGRWKDGNHVRFWKGLPEKLGGWTKVGVTTFTGICRALTDWISLRQERIIALGTHLKLYIWIAGAYSDVTPIRESGTLGLNPFTTVNGSALVSVADVAHGLEEGDYVHYSGAAAVAGITINGEYTVTTVVDADNYKITHSAPANANASGGGAAVAYQYEIHIGLEDTLASFGWGAGAWGAGTWGTPRSSTSLIEMCRIWSLDQWGEDLIASPRGGSVYVWDSSVGPGTRATLITQAPATVRSSFVFPENRTIVALGAHDGAADDAMLVRWSDTEDYTVWTAAEGNTAGDKRLDLGNELYCAVKTKRGTILFSDVYCWMMTFDGPPYTYGFDPVGFNGNICGPNAATELDGVVYWFASKDFKRYDGIIDTLPCDVLNYVLDDFNTTQRAKVYAGINREFGEVWWLYPSSGSSECDRYVLYNKEEGTWAYGELARTVFAGHLKTFALPYAAGTDGFLYDHENTVDANGAALEAFLQSADFEVGTGRMLHMLKKLVPDFERLVGSVDFTFVSKKWPQASTSRTKGPFTVLSSTEYIRPRAKGRQMSLRISSDAVGDDFRMGVPRVELVPVGRK